MGTIEEEVKKSFVSVMLPQSCEKNIDFGAVFYLFYYICRNDNALWIRLLDEIRSLNY